MRTSALVAIVTAAAILVMSPALAETTRVRHQDQQSYRIERSSGSVMSDPSFGYHPNLDRARSLGRCVEDLGYGRFEYCD